MLSGVFPALEGRFRRWGGYIQALLLVMSAGIIYTHLVHLGIRPEASGVVITVIGGVATLFNWWRFKILHPHGNPIQLLAGIFSALRHGRVEKTTFIGEIFHVLTDVGASAIAAISGVFIMVTGNTYFDEAAAVVIALLLVVGATMTTVFAHRHDH
jgi:Co/Zn/Cd efflux system component